MNALIPILPALKAFSDETRLVILDLLSSREFSVGEIVDLLEFGQSRVSRHLKILLNAGLVLCRRDGLWSFYRISDTPVVRALSPLIGSDPLVLEARKRWKSRMERMDHASTTYFDALAPELARVKRHILGVFDPASAIYEALTPDCPVIADLGCGTGELFPVLAQKSAKIIGIDRSEKMLEIAGKRIKGSDPIELRIGSLEHLPLRNNEVHGAVMSMVLHYTVDPVKILFEANRALTPGGLLVILDMAKHDNEALRSEYGHRHLGFSREELESFLEKAGFRIKQAANFEVEQGLSVMLCSSEKLYNA